MYMIVIHANDPTTKVLSLLYEERKPLLDKGVKEPREKDRDNERNQKTKQCCRLVFSVTFK